MAYLLQLDSSADVGSSTSRRLTSEFAAEWVASGSDREVRVRDLHRTQLPHLPTNLLHFVPSRRPGAGVEPTLESETLQQELLDELAAAAAVVIGAPMYNYSMPSTLKACLDYVHVIGANSPAAEGISPMAGKPVAVVSARVTPTGIDPATDFVVGPLIGILGGFMSMDVRGFVVHSELPAAAGDFHRPVDEVREELLACARSWT